MTTPPPAIVHIRVDPRKFETALRKALASAATAMAALGRTATTAAEAHTELRDGRLVHLSHVWPPPLRIDGHAYRRRRTARRHRR